MDLGQRGDQMVADVAGDQQHRGVAWRSGQHHPSVETQPLHLGRHPGTDDRIHRDRGAGGETTDEGGAGHCHSKPRSRHAYRTPRSKMAMNISISTKAITPSLTYTTAHGYMNTISMSKAKNRIAMV